MRFLFVVTECCNTLPHVRYRRPNCPTTLIVDHMLSVHKPFLPSTGSSPSCFRPLCPIHPSQRLPRCQRAHRLWKPLRLVGLIDLCGWLPCNAIRCAVEPCIPEVKDAGSVGDLLLCSSLAGGIFSQDLCLMRLFLFIERPRPSRFLRKFHQRSAHTVLHVVGFLLGMTEIATLRLHLPDSICYD